jgi:hypothetical protein
MKAQVRIKATKVFGIMLACLAMVACGKQEAQSPVPAAGAPAPAATDERQEPAHALLIVLPEKTAPADLPQKLAGWKSSGAVSDAVLIKQFAHEVKPGYSLAFENLAILDFPNESAYEAWKADSAAELGPDVIVSRADVLLDRRSKKNDPTRSIFVVGGYESLVSKDAYKDFTDAYIEPNMANQYFSGIMTRYTMYLEREATGGRVHPKALLVTEYADQAAYDRKASVKDPYKALLLSGTHPEWAHINETKKAIRSDYSETYANPVKL